MFRTGSKDWKEIAETIRRANTYTEVSVAADASFVLRGKMKVLFLDIQDSLRQGVSLETRKDICELLFEIFMKLNTLKPMGIDYKKCFDLGLLDTFIETIKMANNNNGQSFTTYFPSIISWLEDYKKTMSVNMITNIKASNNAR